MLGCLFNEVLDARKNIKQNQREIGEERNKRKEKGKERKVQERILRTKMLKQEQNSSDIKVNEISYFNYLLVK